MTKEEILKMDLQEAYEAYLIIKDELDGEEILENIWLSNDEIIEKEELQDKKGMKKKLTNEEEKRLKWLEGKAETISSLYQKIRFGIDIYFDIYTLFSDEFIKKKKKELIIINKANVTQKNFFTEIENRRLLVKEILCYYYLDDTSLIRAGDE